VPVDASPVPPAAPRPIVLVPTYNELENLDAILDAVLDPGAGALPEAHVLVIDDASPDGTGARADARAAADPRVHVLHRARKEGLGPAYIAGFRWALAHPLQFTHVFEMDADFSHDPRYLRPMLARATTTADLVIGSRYVPGGGTRGWTLTRRLISRGGGLYARAVLGVPVQDLTAGFKCFRREVLEALPFAAFFTAGYGFQIEITYRALMLGFRVVEHPIVFPDRTKGRSKMSLAIASEAARAVWLLRFVKDARLRAEAP
jgi:dolichol-phosphate mannosyltransferase